MFLLVLWSGTVIIDSMGMTPGGHEHGTQRDEDHFLMGLALAEREHISDRNDDHFRINQLVRREHGAQTERQHFIVDAYGGLELAASDEKNEFNTLNASFAEIGHKNFETLSVAYEYDDKGVGLCVRSDNGQLPYGTDSSAATSCDDRMGRSCCDTAPKGETVLACYSSKGFCGIGCCDTKCDSNEFCLGYSLDTMGRKMCLNWLKCGYPECRPGVGIKGGGQAWGNGHCMVKGKVKTPAPTANPTAAPTPAPTGAPTAVPTPVPPTAAPTAAPTAMPTAVPSPGPTVSPTSVPTATPSAAPTANPTVAPTAAPTATTVTTTSTTNKTKSSTITRAEMSHLLTFLLLATGFLQPGCPIHTG